MNLCLISIQVVYLASTPLCLQGLSPPLPPARRPCCLGGFVLADRVHMTEGKDSKSVYNSRALLSTGSLKFGTSFGTEGRCRSYSHHYAIQTILSLNHNCLSGYRLVNHQCSRGYWTISPILLCTPRLIQLCARCTKGFDTIPPATGRCCLPNPSRGDIPEGIVAVVPDCHLCLAIFIIKAN